MRLKRMELAAAVVVIISSAVSAYILAGLLGWV